MRRATAAVLVGGYALGGIGPAPGPQPVIGVSPAAEPVSPAAEPASPAAEPAGSIASAAGLAAAFTPVRGAGAAVPMRGTKTVRYQGYQIGVPASWPVYFLDKDPGQCVRYDISAVYLGTPGTTQDCPARLVGRVDTISIGPVAAPGALTRPAVLARPGTMTILQDAQLHELTVAMPGAAPAVSATYGTSPDLVERMLASVRPTQGAPKTRSTPKTQGTPKTHSTPDTHSTSMPQASPTPQGTPTPQGSPTPTTTPQVTPTPPGSGSPGAAPGRAGFDTCTAPRLRTMRAWRARFSATAIYIGGQMMACGYGNLTADWVRQAEAMGWSLLPVYVGLQAPCGSISGKINPKHAAAQGTAAASQAVTDAGAFGLGKGAPIYYDMEAYDNARAKCVTAVLTFLDAWTRQLRAQGYVSGVYSSAGAAITDLQARTRIAGHSLAKPKAIWFALWDNAANLAGQPYMTPAVWSASARSKQYAGPHVVKVRGITLDIDSDMVNGPAARG